LFLSRSRTDRTDSIMVSDENDARASRIVFQVKENEDQRLVPGTSTHDAVVGGEEHGGGPIGECF